MQASRKRERRSLRPREDSVAHASGSPVTEHQRGERIMAKKPRKPLSERIKLALQEALAHAKGELTLVTITILKVS